MSNNSSRVDLGSTSEPTEPFPTIDNQDGLSSKPSGDHGDEDVEQDAARSREPSDTSLKGRLRSASKKFEESNPPSGMWDATGKIVSSAPSITDIRRGNYGSEGWSGSGQLKDKERRASLVRGGYTTKDAIPSHNLQIKIARGQPGSENMPVTVPETVHEDSSGKVDFTASSYPSGDRNQNESPQRWASSLEKVVTNTNPGQSHSDIAYTGTVANSMIGHGTDPFDNGYQFPPKHSWREATAIGLRGFWKFTCTWLGFLVVIYGLNVVAWGGMLFLLLCNASPAMCTPNCNDIKSPRRVWIEIDSQILTVLFCLTAFGLIPWRFRDLFWLLKYRIRHDQKALRQIAGVNRSWFRLPGSQNLPVTLGPDNIQRWEGETSSVPFPEKCIPPTPLTGTRAPATALWRLDFVIWMYVFNTFLQVVLCGFMWGLNRYNRPSWATGTFVALGCIAAGVGGIMVFVEGKRVKAIEGVPVSERDQERLRRDREIGIVHFNNIKDERPKEKKLKEGHSRKARASNGIQLEEDAVKAPGSE